MVSFFAPPMFKRSTSILTSVTKVDEASSTTSTITWPTVQAGDVAVVLNGAFNSAGIPTDVVPSGFTGVNTAGGGTVRVRASWKKCTGSESGALTVMNGTLTNYSVMYLFRGNIALSAVTSASANQQTTSAAPTNQTVTASGGTTPSVLVFGHGVGNNGGTIAFSGATSPAFDATTSWGSTQAVAGYKIYNSSPADHTVGMADFGLNALLSFYLNVS